MRTGPLRTAAPSSAGHVPVTSRSHTALAVAGFLVPVAVYLLLIHLFGVNLAFRDQWSDVHLVGDSYSGHLSFGDLWSLHNENRVLFPNLFVLLLSRTTQLNFVVEEFAGAILLLLSVALVVVAHRRRVGPIPWLFYVPIVIVSLSLVQYQNTLWGFQFAWFLVLACFAVVVFLLDRQSLTWPLLGLALAAAIVGSFSSLQGLIIWPAGLLLLWFRHRGGAVAATWTGVAVISAALYFIHGAASSGGASTYALSHPWAGVQFYLALLGDVLGPNLSPSGAANRTVELFGLIVLVVAVWGVVLFFRGRLAPRGGPLAVSLVCMGLLFAAFVTGSRSTNGIVAAGQSRYRTFDLLIVVALLLFAIEELARRQELARRRRGGAERRINEAEPLPVSGRDGRIGRSIGVFVGAAVMLAGLQIAVGIPEGIAGARAYHADQVQGARVLADIGHYPDNFVASALGIFQSPTYIRRMAEVLERHRLSMFATGSAAAYRALGPIPLPRPSARIVVPSAHATITGNENLGLSIHDEFTVTKVRFEVTGEGRSGVFVSAAAPFEYGWIGVWHTASFADGTYELDAVVVDAAGHRVTTAAVPVTVHHP